MHGVTVVGGGPAGLYLSLLVKKAQPDLEIRVLERNPPDATYGWGVVFSDQTLSSFRDADRTSFERLHESLVVWDSIEIRMKGSSMRCGGQGFSGIPRRLLLQILQERCRELGVEMEFEREVSDLELVDSNLVVAADGVNSSTRRALKSLFGTRLRRGRARYIWFGTDLALDCFTFIFRANEHGVFQVHAYPFDGGTSTFIVECTEETWQRAGLEDASEQDSIDYCEALFAEDLDGHSLMSNRSAWTRFVTVKNRSWFHRNTVLVGDAAHTAHFSIGSGTKLAMEDSIALADALAGRPDLTQALAYYEAARRPPVARFQDAAAQSQTYFEEIPAHFHLEAPQFALHLLTRSGRIDHTALRVRDPYFVAGVDAWFAGRSDAGQPAAAPPPALAPFQLGGLRLSNRIVVEARPRYRAIDGLPDRAEPERYRSLAGAGAGLVESEPVAICPQGRITNRSPGLYDDDQQEAWARIERAVGDAGAHLMLRLNHAGRRGSSEPRVRAADVPLESGRSWALLAPSAIPYAPEGIVPQEMKPPEMDEISERFVQAAERALEIGIAVLDIHMGHGYLLGSFLSPLTNGRDDIYGGDLDARARYPLEILSAVRAVWAPPRPLVVSVSVDDWAPGGNALDEGVEIARRLSGSCDMVEVLSGQTIKDRRPAYDFYTASRNSDRIRNEARVATLATGAIGTQDAVNTLVGGGRADLCRVIRMR